MPGAGFLAHWSRTVGLSRPLSNDECKTRMKSDELACPKILAKRDPSTAARYIQRIDVGQCTKPYRRVWHARWRHLEAGPQERRFQLATRPRRLRRSAESFAWRNSGASKETQGRLPRIVALPSPSHELERRLSSRFGKQVPNGGLSALRVTLVQILGAEPIARPLMT
ncbi:hypothetical protein CMUS01_13076 [Colletotrichum musicola]|uniref:Uncharacterized protein n=1 Tax=Colletotrichum musicola TaxID=2175873 RepID=A0A8H6MX96_9PEZI|nr:hypothetical protein CMUS01_13076 [Colletotrichum musicola]